MKDLMLVVILIIATGIFFIGQQTAEPAVPKVVKQSFECQFPDSVQVKWEKEKNDYEADFKIKGVEYSALFDHSGKCVATKLVGNSTSGNQKSGLIQDSE